MLVGLLVAGVVGASFAYYTQNNWRTGNPKVYVQLISIPPKHFSILSRQRTQKLAVADAVDRKLASRKKQGFDDPIVVIQPKKGSRGRWLVVRKEL